MRIIVFIVALAIATSQSRAETKEEWIALGARIHGAFGVLIPIGIRIGLDAKDRLKAAPRDLMVTFHTGRRAPCPCIADGIMLATGTSPGQGTLVIAPDYAGIDQFAMIEIKNKKTGEALRYVVPGEMAASIGKWNRELDPSGRYDVVMQAEGLFRVEPAN